MLHFFTAKHLGRHYLLSGDANGAIILWELSNTERQVVTFELFFLSSIFRIHCLCVVCRAM